MLPGPRHRHGFAALINGARCIATMQPASAVSFACSSPVDWGCQRAGKYAIKGRLIHAAQPLFVFRGRMRFFRVIFSIGPFDRWDHGFAGSCVFGSFLCP
jgi:hypothetical protein